MKVTVEKSELLAAVERCRSVTDPKSTIPVLAHVHLQANRDNPHGLHLDATDLFRAISLGIQAKIDEEGELCLPARDLADRVRQLPDGKIALSTEGTKASLKTVGNARRFTLHGIPGDEFSTIPEWTGTDSKLTTTTHQIAKLIGAVHLSVSSDPGQLQLHSLFLESDQNGLRMVGLDGHRMNVIQYGAEPGPGASRWLIPLPAVNDLRKLFDTKTDQEVTLAQHGDNLFVNLPEFTFSAKLVAKDYPPWQQLVPKSPKYVITANRAALAEALRAVSVSASDRTGGVKLTFRKGAIVLQAEDHDKGDGFDEVPTDYEGETTSIGFNSRYLLDALSVLGTEQVTFSLDGELEPALIRATGSDDFLAIVMPMRV